MDVVTGLVAEKPVVIFSKSSCCMSHSINSLICSFGANLTVYELDQIPSGRQIERAHSINSLICSFGANLTVYELDQIPSGRQIERALLQLGCQPCVPAVFIGQEFIGGANEVMSLQVRNELVPLLIRSKAIWIWNKSK